MITEASSTTGRRGGVAREGVASVEEGGAASEGVAASEEVSDK